MLKKSLSANGVEVVGTEIIKTGEKVNPDASLISALSPEASAILIQGRKLGIPVNVPFIVTVTLRSEQIRLAGDAAEGTISFTSWVSTADTSGNQVFVDNYRAKYGMEPNVFAAQA